MPVTVAMISPLPPPLGGIATWTQGLLRRVVVDPEVEIVHLNSAVRFRMSERLSMWRRVSAGVAYSSALLVSLFATLVTKRLDVVHLCTSGSIGLLRDVASRVLAWTFRVPVVVHFRHGRLPQLAASRNWERFLVRMVCSLGAHAVVLDEMSAAALRSIAPGCRVDLIPNPAWNLEATVPVGGSCEVPVLVFAGYVIPAKGVRELVLACREIRNWPFRLEVIGPVEQSLRNELQTLARARDDGRWLEFLGPIDSDTVASRVAKGYAVILPSYSEGFPNIVIEAMVQSKPVVATAVGAIPEILLPDGPQACGICVPARDVQSLRSAIELLLGEPSQALEFGRRGRERVVRLYSPDPIYASYRALWMRCREESILRARRRIIAGPAKVLLVAPTPPPFGGVASWTEGLIGYVHGDAAIELVCVNSAVRFRPPLNTSILYRLVAGPADSTRILVQVAKGLWSSRADVLHLCSSASFGLVRDILVIALCRLRGVGSVFHLHFGRIPALAARENWETALLRLACKLASHTIVLDRMSAECVHRMVGNCSVSVVPNPAWSIDELQPRSKGIGGELVVVFVGNVTPDKGVRELVGACCQISDVAFELHLLGRVTTSFREELVCLARARGEGRWLRVHGAVAGREVLPFLARSSALVLPSHTEGFPMSILEAMAMGKPVIATAVGAIPNLLLSGTEEACGICVPVGDVDALRDAIRQLLDQPSLCRELGLRGRARVADMCAPHVVYPMYRALWGAVGRVKLRPLPDQVKATVCAESR